MPTLKFLTKGIKNISALESYKDFKKLLKDIYERINTRSSYMINTLTGLGSTASKHPLGPESSVAIRANT